MSDYSRWKDTIEKHDREDGICPLLDDVFEQGIIEASDKFVMACEDLDNCYVSISQIKQIAEKLKEYIHE